MDIFSLLDALYEEVRSEEWSDIEAKYEKLARKAAGADVAKAIAATDLTEFQRELAENLTEALEAAAEDGSAALYYEYDIDNDWASVFFLCPEYLPESEGDDDWAADYDREIEGPSIPEFTELYNEHGGFDTGEAENAVTLFLIARTVCAFGRALANVPEGDLAICIGYHDQDPIWRLRDLELEEDDDYDEDDDESEDDEE